MKDALLAAGLVVAGIWVVCALVVLALALRSARRDRKPGPGYWRRVGLTTLLAPLTIVPLLVTYFESLAAADRAAPGYATLRGSDDGSTSSS